MSYDLHKKYGDMRLLDTPICGAHSSLSSHACTVRSAVKADDDIAMSCPG